MDGLQRLTVAAASKAYRTALGSVALHQRLGIQGSYFVIAQEAMDRVTALAKRLTARRCHVFHNDDGSVTVALWETDDAPAFQRLMEGAIVDAVTVAPKSFVTEMRLCGDASAQTLSTKERCATAD